MNRDDPIWFDEDCRKAKNEIRHTGRSLQKNPNDLELRKCLYDRKRNFKKLTKTKKSKHTEKTLDDMYRNKNMSESKKFWNALNKLDNEKGM